MTTRAFLLGMALWLTVAGDPAVAQDRPSLREMQDFMTKGSQSELDADLCRHRLNLAEIERDGLDGRPTRIGDIVAVLARYEKLTPRVDEPLEVRGDMRIWLTPNTTGRELFTTCFLGLTYNGLVLSGNRTEFVLARPESRKDVPLPRRRWNPNRILSTRLFRLGYLASDPILRKYRDEIGTGEGNAVIVPKANVVIVTDTDDALDALGARIDSETIAAMGSSATDEAAGEARPPSLGAVASRECLHFYLMAFARSHRMPFYAARQQGAATRSYPEADVWLNDRGYQMMSAEYRRVSELIPVAREAAEQGWVDPRPDRTLAPAAQKRLEIRFGLVSPLPGGDRERTSKKAARRKR